MTIHELETLMWRWRRRADGLYAALLSCDPTQLTEQDRIAIENYCNDRFDDPDHFTKHNMQGANQ